MSTPLWAPEEIVAATGARLSGDVKPASGASIDTRTLQPGDLFFAIAGEARDGHAFVRDALAKGAAAAVIAEERGAGVGSAGPVAVAPAALNALRRLGIAARCRTDARIVAV